MSKNNSTYTDLSIPSHPDANAWPKAGFKDPADARTWVLAQATKRSEDAQALVEYARRFGVPALKDRIEDEERKGIHSPLIASWKPDDVVLSDILQGAVAGIVSSLANKYSATIEQRVEEALKSVVVTHRMVSVQVNGVEPPKHVGLTHKSFDTIFKLVQNTAPSVAVVGPAGSGKTHLCAQIAEAMSLPFYSSSICPQSTKTDLTGFITLNGMTVMTDFVKAYHEGGVYLLDEIDAGNSAVLLVLNAAIEQDYLATPHGTYKKHKDFRLLASANTIGCGGDLMYVGRNALDEAVRDRFAFVVMDYDRELESALHGAGEWTQYVWAIREIIAQRRMRVLASTRTIRNGYAAFNAGVPIREGADLAFWSKISLADAANIRAELDSGTWNPEFEGTVNK